MTDNNVLIWDFHGTLVDSSDIWTRAAFSAVQTLFPANPLEFQTIKQNTDFQLFPWHDPAQDYLDFVIPAAWWAKINSIYCSTFEKCGFSNNHSISMAAMIRPQVLDKSSHRLKPDAVSTLAWLKARGWRHIMLSNNFPELEQVCTELEISGYFDQIFVSALIGYEKPRRELFEFALGHIGSYARCFMIWDSLKADILGAREVNIGSILIGESDSPLPDFICRNLSDIRNLLPAIS